MGQVYQATDTKLNRQVALKILPEAFATDPDRLARFQREAQILASLNHPGIAAIYGIEGADDTRALVLELVEGPTLEKHMAGFWRVRALDRRPAQESANSFQRVRDACRVAGELHSRGVRQKLALTADSRLDQIAAERSKEADHYQPCPECQHGQRATVPTGPPVPGTRKGPRPEA